MIVQLALTRARLLKADAAYRYETLLFLSAGCGAIEPSSAVGLGFLHHQIAFKTVGLNRTKEASIG